jgi:N-acetylneuraminic acid mutarotase
MWNMYTSKVIKIQAGNIKNKFNESMDSLFEKVDSIFEDVEKVVDSVDEDDAEWQKGNSSSYQSSGGTTITNNNGHIVIEGKVKSLKVNGVDVELEKIEK